MIFEMNVAHLDSKNYVRLKKRQEKCVSLIFQTLLLRKILKNAFLLCDLLHQMHLLCMHIKLNFGLTDIFNVDTDISQWHNALEDRQREMKCGIIVF